MKIPLSEHFHSIQGEGQWVGTPMHFIRLPGCSVGRKIKDDTKSLPGVAIPYPSPKVGSHDQRAWLCHTYNGKRFWCDTDFNKYEEVELEDLLKETWEEHICLTGGEPLIHKEIINAFLQCRLAQRETSRLLVPPYRLHIETSGTIDFWWEADLFQGAEAPLNPWVTVSPKQGWTPYMVHHANELKLLISSDTPDTFDPAFLAHPNVYLSPINDVGYGTEDIAHINSRASLERCFELLKSHPNWRLSPQLHKYLNVR